LVVTLVVIWGNNTPHLSDLSRVVSEIFQCIYSVQDGCRTMGKSPQKKLKTILSLPLWFSSTW